MGTTLEWLKAREGEKGEKMVLERQGGGSLILGEVGSHGVC